MPDDGHFGADGYPHWLVSFERPGLRWPLPFPEGEDWLPDGILQLDAEVDAVAALAALRSDTRLARNQCPAARLLISSVNHLIGGAPTIDWRIMFDLVDGLVDRLQSTPPLEDDAKDLMEQLGITRDLIARAIAHDIER